MKKRSLLAVCLAATVLLSGCIVVPHGHHDHGRHKGQSVEHGRDRNRHDNGRFHFQDQRNDRCSNGYRRYDH